MDKNKNDIPDWVENLAYYAGAVLLFVEAYKKVKSGEPLTNALDVTYTTENKGGKNANNGTK